MLIRCVVVAILVTLSLLFAGCYGSKETENIAFVQLVGVDRTESGKEKVTYTIAVPRGLNGGDEKSPWMTDTIVIPSSGDGRMLLKSTMSRSPKYSHISVEIWSEQAARRGVDGSMAFNIRSRDFRGAVYFIVVQGSAEEYIRRNKPKLESTLTRFFESNLTITSISGYYLPATFHDFYNRLKNEGGSPYMTYSGINPMTGENKPTGVKMPEQKGDPYLPGGIPRTGTENPIDFSGLAVFRGYKMVGVLNSDESRAVAILQGKLPSSYVSVVDPLEPEKDTISLNVRAEHKPKVTTALNGGAPVFNVEVRIESEIMGITSGINYEAPGYRELLETQVANLFKGQITAMIKHTQELGTDPVGFGLYLRPHFQNTAELDQADTTALYQAADIRVNVTAKIRRAGLTWRTSPPRIE